MSEQTPLAPKILVGLDGSPNSAAALRWAVEEAESHQAAVEAVFVWQVPSLAYSAPGYIPLGPADIQGEARRIFDDALAGLDTGGVDIHLLSFEGTPVAVLSRAACDPDVNCVVVGARGHGGVAGLLLGSVSHALTHHCSKPLVIVPPGWNESATDQAEATVVVGVDDSDESARALTWAVREARIKGSTVRVVWAWSTPSPVLPAHLPLRAMEAAGESNKVLDALRTFVAQVDTSGVKVDYHVVAGRPAQVLTDLASHAQLLVVGSRGRGLAHEAVSGSVSHAVTHRASVPVAVIPRTA